MLLGKDIFTMRQAHWSNPTTIGLDVVSKERTRQFLADINRALPNPRPNGRGAGDRGYRARDLRDQQRGVRSLITENKIGEP